MALQEISSRSSFGKTYRLHHRTAAGHDRGVVSFWRGEPGEVVVRRDDSLNLWMVRSGEPGDGVRLISPDRTHWKLYPSHINDRAAPPTGWIVLASAGVFLAFLLVGGSMALPLLTDSTNATHREWVAARRGDASIAAIAMTLCASGLLVAALVQGLLT